MGLQERMNFLNGLAANPTANGAQDLGPGPAIGHDVEQFLNRAAGSGKMALAGAASKDENARYKYMSIGSAGLGPKDKDALFSRPVGEFFCKLFRSVRDLTGHGLSKSDLWHGHLIDLRNGNGVCVVFHAKEYPRDLPTNSPSETQGSFSSEDQSFRYRNVLWKHSGNRLYKVDAGVYKKSEQRVFERSPLFDNVIRDGAAEWRALGAEYERNWLAARTLPQEEMGTQRVDLYYLVDESFLTWKSSHIVMRPMT